MFVSGLICTALLGCEVRPYYGIELVDVDESGPQEVIQKSDFDLHLSVGNSSDSPAISLIAVSNDWPAEPQWDWDEFQSWPKEKRATVFGNFYDRKYRDLSVSHTLACPLMIENFDHRESAQDVAYGTWLHSLQSDDIGIAPKGLVVTVPIAGCDRRSKSPAGDVEEITVIVDAGHVEKPEQVNVSFRVYLIDTDLHWLF